MKTNTYPLSDPSIFSSGSLKLTYNLIRKQDAELALTIRNITRGTPVTKNTESEDKLTDHFKVDLDSFQVRAIVENLMRYCQTEMEKGNNPGGTVIAKALSDDWISLAHKMVSELPDDQKP